MEVVFTRQFEKDVGEIRDKELAERIEAAVLDIKNAGSISDIKNIKKLKGV